MEKLEIIELAKHNGWETAKNMLIEEMSELAVAINKLWRYDNKLYRTEHTRKDFVCNVIEEAADVQIMLDQIFFLIGESCNINVEEKLQDIKKKKIERQKVRNRLADELNNRDIN